MFLVQQSFIQSRKVYFYFRGYVKNYLKLVNFLPELCFVWYLIVFPRVSKMQD